MLFKINFLAHVHEETNSLRLFKVANSGLHAYIIKYFSHRQKYSLFQAKIRAILEFQIWLPTTINGPLTNQMRLIYTRLTNEMRLIYQIDQSDAHRQSER